MTAGTMRERAPKDAVTQAAYSSAVRLGAITQDGKGY